MTSNELKNLLRKSFPSLKKPFWGRDVIECRDGDYPTIQHYLYLECDEYAWNMVGETTQYDSGFPDCDDYSDMKLGRFKESWRDRIQLGVIPTQTPPSYAVCDGYNPNGVNHNFNLFRSDRGLFVSDYGEVKPIDGYKPMRVRF